MELMQKAIIQKLLELMLMQRVQLQYHLVGLLMPKEPIRKQPVILLTLKVNIL
jgi:hypothetical protein